MTTEFMRDLLSKDEKITVEYKTCQFGIQEDVYETVCSFSNRYGGYIIMGAEDDGTPIGVKQNMVKDMKRNFVNQLNNPDKMSPTLYLSIEDFEYEGKVLLWVYVPPTATVEKCGNRIYDRNEDGDMDITDSPIQLQNMYNRKSTTYAEHKIFPYVTKDDLRLDLMDKVRNLAKSKNPDHQWLTMSDEEILTSAGLWEKDFSSGIQGYNLAGVLLFGKDEVIRSCCPGYITDAIYRVENVDRYDDRLQVMTNLIEAYDLLMEFVSKHTSDKFCLIDNVNTSIRGIIAREVIGNILVHRDYSSAFPAKVIIEKDWLKTENWCIPRRHGNIMSDEFTPYPKNPLIQQFFANIGRTDTIGSGVRNLYKNPGCFDMPDKTFIDLYMKSGLYITEIVKRLYQSDEMKKQFPDNKERLKHIFEKQVYGLAPTEIIYKIATSYILGFDEDTKNIKHNFRQLDALPYAKEGTLDQVLDELYSKEE